MSISVLEVKLFSAECIANTCSLWEFGGSWILNFRKRVLFYYIRFPFLFLLCCCHAFHLRFWSILSQEIQRGGVRCCKGPLEVWGWKPVIIKACQSPKYQNPQLFAAPFQGWIILAEEHILLPPFCLWECFATLRVFSSSADWNKTWEQTWSFYILGYLEVNTVIKANSYPITFTHAFIWQYYRWLIIILLDSFSV